MIIYKATNIINNKCYIGQTINELWTRKGCHKRQSKNPKPTSYFHRAIKKYGWDNFHWEILCECDTREELDEMEYHYIRQYRMIDGVYNVADGGLTNHGYVFTEEHRRNISKAQKGKKKSYIAGKKNGMYGKKHTKQALDKISSAVKQITKRGADNPQSKSYIVINPFGDVFMIKGMKKFCDDNRLTPKGMRLVMQGKQNHHKGWFCRSI